MLVAGARAGRWKQSARMSPAQPLHRRPGTPCWESCKTIGKTNRKCKSRGDARRCSPPPSGRPQIWPRRRSIAPPSSQMQMSKCAGFSPEVCRLFTCALKVPRDQSRLPRDGSRTPTAPLGMPLGGCSSALRRPSGSLQDTWKFQYFEQNHRKVRAPSRDPAEGSRNADRRMGIRGARPRPGRLPWEPCGRSKKHVFLVIFRISHLQV